MSPAVCSLWTASTSLPLQPEGGDPTLSPWGLLGLPSSGTQGLSHSPIGGPRAEADRGLWGSLWAKVSLMHYVTEYRL